MGFLSRDRCRPDASLGAIAGLELARAPRRGTSPETLPGTIGRALDRSLESRKPLRAKDHPSNEPRSGAAAVAKSNRRSKNMKSTTGPEKPNLETVKPELPEKDRKP